MRAACCLSHQKGWLALAAGHADGVAGGHGGLENEQAASWLLITLSCPFSQAQKQKPTMAGWPAVCLRVIVSNQSSVTA